MPEGLPFDVSGESLSGYRMLNLQTAHGDLDLTMRPAAFDRGYDDLVGRSTYRPVGEVQVRVAALDDVIASKEAAGRPKDLRALPELWRLAGQARATANFPAQAARGRVAGPAVPAERIAAPAPSWSGHVRHTGADAARRFG